jgi:3-mercaptopyruvate sulfurtransferase SseA
MGNINGHETRVTASWLRMRLAEPETARRICLIDATPGHDGTCLPHARPLDLRALLQSGPPTAGAFQAAIRAIGATSHDQVVIYDRDMPLAASVLWRLFQAFGHPDACVLEGGYAAWHQASAEIARGYTSQEPGTWRAREGPIDGELLADIGRLQQSAPNS